MWARYDTTTRRLRHWSTTPFTLAPQADEADCELPAVDVTLPGPIDRVRVAGDGHQLELDPPSTPPARALAFAAAIHLNLAGDDGTARFARAVALRNLSVLIVATFVNDLRLAGNSASRGAIVAIQSSWAAVKNDPVIGSAGTAIEHLTVDEIARIEMDAQTNFGLSLVPQ